MTRLQKELKTIRETESKGDDVGWSAGPVDEQNLFKWEGFLFGPTDTPFQGGVFKISIIFSPEYPIKPPSVKFVTVPYHPNVYANGDICLDILKDQWTPALQIDQLLQSIRSLLTDPNPNSPANAEAAQMYSRDRARYDEKIRKMVAAANGAGSSGSGGGGSGGGSAGGNNGSTSSSTSAFGRALF